jgi:hypothetical protein
MTFQRLRALVLDQLRQGITPEKIALTIAAHRPRHPEARRRRRISKCEGRRISRSFAPHRMTFERVPALLLDQLRQRIMRERIEVQIAATETVILRRADARAVAS